MFGGAHRRIENFEFAAAPGPYTLQARVDGQLIEASVNLVNGHTVRRDLIAQIK